MRPRDRLTAAMNEPYEQLRTAAGLGARLDVSFDGEEWVARVIEGGRRKPAGVGRGERLDEACRALAVELGVERWKP
jgi:hypothetical protein